MSISQQVGASSAKLPEVKTVYEKNKRSNNIHQILNLVEHNIKREGTLDKFRPKLQSFNAEPIYAEQVCLLEQKDLKNYKHKIEH